jgi:hypothetical protein
VPQPVTGRVPGTGTGAGAGAMEDVGLGEDGVGPEAGEDDVGPGVGQVHVGVGVGVGDVEVGVGVGGEEGQDTQNTFCLAAPCSPVNVQKSL